MNVFSFIRELVFILCFSVFTIFLYFIFNVSYYTKFKYFILTLKSYHKKVIRFTYITKDKTFTNNRKENILY